MKLTPKDYVLHMTVEEVSLLYHLAWDHLVEKSDFEPTIGGDVPDPLYEMAHFSHILINALHSALHS